MFGRWELRLLGCVVAARAYSTLTRDIRRSQSEKIRHGFARTLFRNIT